MKQRILAVDDELHMLKLLERIITEKTPYQITVTNNGLEVPRLLDQTRFDLIVTDLKMPGMDGMDILRFVKDQGRSEEVIMITAFGSLESATEALSKGVFDYITKPFKKEQIIFTVDRAMRWQRMRREVARIAAIFALEPYQQARAAFEEEYIRQVTERCGGDQGMASQRSGLSVETVAAVLSVPPQDPR